VVPRVDIQSFQVTTTLDGNDLPFQSLEEKWSYVVIEKVDPMGIEELSPSTSFKDTMIALEEPVHSEAAPLRGLSVDQLQLIFDMR
jgi:hypothetical protein